MIEAKIEESVITPKIEQSEAPSYDLGRPT
jgi:hypothetical protein